MARCVALAALTAKHAVAKRPVERRVMTPITVLLVVAFVATGLWGQAGSGRAMPRSRPPKVV